MTGSDLVGPFYVHGNVAGRYIWSHNTNFGLNSVIGAEANPMKVGGDTVLASRLLFEGYCAGVTPGGSVTAVRAGGTITRFYIEKPTRITYVDITLDTEITTGDIFVRFLKNGVNEGYRLMTSTDGRHKRAFWANIHDCVTCSSGDYIEIQLGGSAALSTYRWD